MTTKVIMELERENMNTIILFREGIFWKAYEKSAYAFHHQIQPYKLTKKHVPSINGELVSLGFPTGATDNILSGRKVLLTEDYKMILESEGIDNAQFETWKEQIPLMAPIVKDNVVREGVVTMTRTTQQMGIQSPPPASMAKIVENIRLFNLESKTPVECMLFLMDIKKQLAEQEGNTHG